MQGTTATRPSRRKTRAKSSGVVDHVAVEGLADEPIQVHQHVEGGLRADGVDAGNGGHALVEVVPAGLKGLPHDLDLILGAAEGLGGGGLGDGAGAGEAVAEVVAHDLDDLLAGRGKADAPAGHGVGLGGTRPPGWCGP